MVAPRICHVPPGNGDLGKRAVDLAADAGLELDDWQAFSLEQSLLRADDGRWAAFEFGECVPRQNGKGSVIEARLLAELYLVKSSLSIYSAHNFDTADEHFRRMVGLIEDCPRLAREVKGRRGGNGYGIRYGSGQQGIELNGNRRLRFRTRTASGGRGFACDGVLVLDEAMVISEAMHGALFPIMSGKTLEVPGPQIWYTGSAVDQLVHEHGVVFSRVRERGLSGDAARLAWLEWSVEGDNPDAVPDSVAGDVAAWAQANPALGIRISPEYLLETEFHALARRSFAVERLGVGDWPRTDYTPSVLDLEKWAELEDPLSAAEDPVCVAFDVSPDRFSSVAIAGRRKDGGWHVEVIASRRSTAWVPDYVAGIVERHWPSMVVCDAYGPASSLIPALEALDVTVEALTSTEHSRACGQFVDAIESGTVRYRPDEVLHSAVRAAQTRPLGDAWAWSRKNSSANISPLVAVTLALSAAMNDETAPSPTIVLPKETVG